MGDECEALVSRADVGAFAGDVGLPLVPGRAPGLRHMGNEDARCSLAVNPSLSEAARGGCQVCACVRECQSDIDTRLKAGLRTDTLVLWPAVHWHPTSTQTHKLMQKDGYRGA